MRRKSLTTQPRMIAVVPHAERLKLYTDKTSFEVSFLL
jgi:hypothetical protein